MLYLLTSGCYFVYRYLMFISYIWLNYITMFHTKEGGKELKKHLQSIGIMGIKFGQYLYSRKDIISNDVADELESFLSDNKTHSLEETLKIIGKDRDRFISIGKVIGSGSLAQVHECVWEGNIDCVVKVLHPDAVQLKTELYYLETVIDVLTWMNLPILLNIDWKSYFNYIRCQVDLQIEGDNLKYIYPVYRSFPYIDTPNYIFGNESFIVMTYCEGTPLNSIDRSSDQYLRAIQLTSAFFLTSYQVHSFCHGDLHEGNILVKKDGNISVIDFGLASSKLKKDEKYSIYYFNRMLGDPSYTNILVYFQCIINSRNIQNQEIDLVKHALNFEKRMEKIDRRRTSTVESFNIFMSFIQENGLVIRGEVLIALIQFINIDSTTIVFEHLETKRFPLLLAILFMKKEPFFVNKMGYDIQRFYNEFVKLVSDSDLKYVEDFVDTKRELFKQNNTRVLQSD